MPYTYLLAAVMLASLLRCAPGAPVDAAPTDSPAGDPSGDEGDTEGIADPLTPWDVAITRTEGREKEFEGGLHNEVEFHILKNYEIPSLPETCPKSNFSKEACLHRLIQGLQTYTVFLKRVDEDFPGSPSPSESNLVRETLGLLLSFIRNKMRHPERVTALTGSQEEQLLRDISNSDTFHRKMIALRVLGELRIFLIEGKRAMNKRERLRSGMTPVTFLYRR